ncbi:MAG: 1-deoxy-D-xylulose-5-phosphate synthase [Campylobacterales bacterium]|nr:1-deoxy-D-xylulose-5-phosphate synthase [Campylobacterales bacterium]
MDIKGYSTKELKDLSEKIRDRILEVVSKNGGHLSSSLGATDIILAMHKAFDVNKDPFIYDVSHQAYAHKLINNRWDSFETLRSFEGLSGFTKPKESEKDYFIAGHSSTSISVAVGAAKAIALKGEDRVPVALIGDGSMSSGMVYEAMNELGHLKLPVVIIINDNEMSIAKPIGAISNYLSKHMAGRFYQKLKHTVDDLLDGHDSMKYLAKRFEESLKLITPGMLFEELGLDYIGPINGHNIKEMVEVFETAKKLGKPVVVHAQTTKGKGYKIAEGLHEHWHGVGPFDVDTGESKKSSGSKSATAIFSDALLDLAKKDEKVVGITAAMPSGTGLSSLMDEMPDRFWDVAIAEQHAVTSAAALAKEGLKPFVAIYSTFLQRGFDQIIHDVAIDNLPVIFAIDRGGIVGEDGETHQGTFDISYLRLIPNMVIFAPRDEATLIDAVSFAANLNKPCAFRYPRGAFVPHKEVKSSGFQLGKAELLKEEDSEILLVGYGNGASKALKVAEELEKNDKKVSVLDLRFVKPIDKQSILSLAKKKTKWYIISDSVGIGGVKSGILEVLSEEGISVEIHSFELPDEFLVHGNTSLIEDSLGISTEKIVNKILE